MMNPNLPEWCYSVNLVTNAVIVLKNGVKGYYCTDIPVTSYENAEIIANERNEILEVTSQERKAMEFCSMNGWDTDPKLN